MKEADTELSRLAAVQHGAFARGQAVALGVSSNGCDRRLAAGRWHATAHPGVYVLPDFAPTWHQRLMAAVLAGPEGTVASHRAGAVLHGLREPGVVEITVPIESNHRFPSTRVHRSRCCGEAIALDGIQCTRVERTLVDLGAVVGDDAVESALEAALRQGLTTAARVRADLDRLARPGRRGVARLRRVLDRRRDGRPAGSNLEVRMIQQLRAADLPDPVRQHEVRIAGEHYFIDLAYPERRVAIELDSREHHEGAEVFQRDRARQNDLVLAGWTILRFTWVDVAQGTAAAAVARGLAA
jgi:very-short-patch-repair endonuclease